MALEFLDFFAGAGGFRKGMEMAGHICVGHCEWDKFANMSYKEIHQPKEGEWFGKDIRDTRANELPRSDVWCFGFPCQDISVAGKQLGFKGERSSLFFTVTRLIRDTKEENRPKYLFIENVKNLLSVNGGTDFLKLLIELDEIGYDAEWQVLNSKNFGVPQNRERVFIIGHIRGRSGRKVFPIGGNCTTIKIEGGKRLADYRYDEGLRIRKSGESPCLKANMQKMTSDKDLSNAIYVIGTTKSNTAKGTNCRSWVHDTKGIIGAITATEYKQPKQIMVQACLSPDRVNKRQNGRRFKNPGEPMFALTTQDRHGVLIKNATQKGYLKAYPGDGIDLEQIDSSTRRGRVQTQSSQTLTTSNNKGVLTKDYRIRKLTPLECWRLQGWNDDDFEKAKKVCSDSQLYKQAGNGVTVTVIYEIAKKIE